VVKNDSEKCTVHARERHLWVVKIPRGVSILTGGHRLFADPPPTLNPACEPQLTTHPAARRDVRSPKNQPTVVASIIEEIQAMRLMKLPPMSSCNDWAAFPARNPLMKSPAAKQDIELEGISQRSPADMRVP
jgi:hypothetical protein